MNDDNALNEGPESKHAEPFEPDLVAEPPHPINWNLLTSHDLKQELLELNRWVNWLRLEYGIPAAVIPPLWHRHPELIWELSALHLHWLCAYDAEQDGSAPLGWHRDFADARQRLRDWVTVSGTRLDRDRPTRQTVWPGKTAPSTSSSMSSLTETPTSSSSSSNRSKRARPQRMRSSPPSTNARARS